MKRLVVALLLAAPFSAVAKEGPHAAHAAPPADAASSAAAVLGVVLRDNAAFARVHDRAYFDAFRDEQHPRVTLVACSDSRFHDQAVAAAPDGDLFEIRNIGNQIDASAGSVEYGVHHLHTPLLLVVGHVGCGAVKAAMEDYGERSPAVRRELDGLHLSLLHAHAQGAFEQRWLANVVGNVHQQVAVALHEYAAEVKEGKLFVVGAVYDFRDDLGGGRGRLHVIDVNGETDAKRIAESALLKGAKPRGN